MNKYKLFFNHRLDLPLGTVELSVTGEALLLSGTPIQLAPAYTVDEQGNPVEIVELSLVPIPTSFLIPEMREEDAGK